MEKVIQKAYYIIAFIAVGFFCLLLAFFRLDVQRRDAMQGYEHLTEFQAQKIQDKMAPRGVRNRYTFTLGDVEGAYSTLMVYSVHQNVEIYVEDECIYSMKAKRLDMAGKSPGRVWNHVSFSPEDSGKTVHIDTCPLYARSSDAAPDCYFGDAYSITKDMIMKEIPAIILSVIAIVTGLIYIFLIFYQFKDSDVERGLLMLGSFAIQVGLWKLADTDILPLLLPDFPVFSVLPFMALSLICVPFTLFVRNLYSTKEKGIWYVPCIAGLVSSSLIFYMQFFGIVDMRESLFMTHGIMVLVLIIATVMAVKEIRTVGWNANLRRNFFCIAFCFLGAIGDIVIYYVSDGMAVTILGMVGFVTYIVVLGLSSIREVKKLMDIGIRAERYEKMAYHDQLTGLYNRTAYAEYTGQNEFVADRCIVMVLDLNNLKKCNDTLGHDKGDIYIKKSADAIKDYFGDIARCYRVGGDEFTILTSEISLYICKQKVEALKDKITSLRKFFDGFDTGIACGYAVYDKRIDYDIYDTVRRADRMMYEEKFAMKRERAAEEK